MAGMLRLTGDTVNIMSLIGLILLMGLVTKNAILLIDYTKVLRREQGMDRRTALITAGRTRLRPILMTTLAMIFGMVPLALALGQGAEMRAPMARAVIGGLITSTILTLLVVPVVYSLLDDFAEWLHRRWTKSNALEVDAHAGSASHVAKAAVTGLLLAALCLPATARAETAPPPESPARILTLEDAVRIASEKNYDIQKARSYQDWVKGKYIEERAAALPHVGLQGAGGRSWDGSFQALFGDLYPAGQTVYSGQVTLAQTLFTWGKVGAAIRGAKEGIASAEDQLNVYRQAAVRDTSSAFFDVLLAKEVRSIAAQNLAQRERHQLEARNRYTLGTATDYDVLAAEVAVANARPDVLRAENAVRTAGERLRLVLAEPYLKGDVSGSLEVEPSDPPDFEVVVREALDKRPDLSDLRHRINVYSELVTIARAGDKPRLDLQGAAGWKELEAGPLKADGKTWNIGLSLSFPFFDGLATKGKVIEARSDRDRAAIEEAKTRDEVALQVRTTLDQVRVAASIIRALTGTVEQARRLLSMAEKGFEYGVKTRIDVDDANLNLRHAEGSLANARRDYLVARVTLEWVKGTL
jgi:HAE1 family hydrophobic/amphiphilic exporter-1